MLLGSQAGVAVDVHGRGHVAVPHEFLLHTDGSARFVQEGTIRVPEDVPTNSRMANLLTGRLQNLLLNDARVVAAAGDVRRKDKPGRSGSPPIAQDLSKCRIKWNVIVGRLGLHSSDPAVDDTLLNQHRSGPEVDMLPAKGQYL